VTGPFEAGERVLLVDQRNRTYLVRLVSGAVYHTHAGTLEHDAVIGAREGTRVDTSAGMVLVAFRPRFADFVLKMPRGAQVVYPKDIGPILTYADIFPGARVLEAGTGSGALTIALCRAVGDQGLVVSYEARPEHHERALENVEAFFGKVPDTLEMRIGDVSEAVLLGESFERCVLDLPEPWKALEAVAPILDPGAVVVAYLPTTGQVQQLVVSLGGLGLRHLETFEVMRRSWHVSARSVRPDHRMVAHTGFITIARRSTEA
jgi:tRNA (adenine57-N1/adenine58-N1)-methyltransferase